MLCQQALQKHSKSVNDIERYTNKMTLIVNIFSRWNKFGRVTQLVAMNKNIYGELDLFVFGNLMYLQSGFAHLKGKTAYFS